MDTRKTLDGQAMDTMLVLCLIWGLQQVVLKATAAGGRHAARTHK